MVRKLLFAGAVLALLVGMPSVASAQAETETVVFHGVTETMADVNPCTGDPVTVTLTYNGVLHSTADAQGGAHFTGTFAGTVEVVPVDPSLPTYTGHFAQWIGANSSSNSDGFWVTFNAKVFAPDGSMVSFNGVTQFHFSNGVLHVEFEMVNVRCRS